MTIGGPGNDPRPLNDYLVSSRLRCFGGSGQRVGRQMRAARSRRLREARLDPALGLAHRSRRRCSLSTIAHVRCWSCRVSARSLRVSSVRTSRCSPVARARWPFDLAATRATRARRPVMPTPSFKRSASEHARVSVYLHANVTAIKLDPRRSTRRVPRSARARWPQAQRSRSRVRACRRRHRERAVDARIERRASRRHRQSFRLARARASRVTRRSRRATARACRCCARTSQLGLFDNQQRTKPHAVIGLSDAAQHRYRTIELHRDVDGRSRRCAEGRSVPREARATDRRCARDRATFRLFHDRAHAEPQQPHHLVAHATRRARFAARAPGHALRRARIRFDRRGDRLPGDRARPPRNRARALGREARSARATAWSSPSRHHMGATRMARSPREGVVDEQCRVHGVDNLYVAGSSVFPTSGIANPTLTLLALTFRLGDHLAAATKAIGMIASRRRTLQLLVAALATGAMPGAAGAIAVPAMDRWTGHERRPAGWAANISSSTRWIRR